MSFLAQKQLNLQTCFKTDNVCWTNVTAEVHPAKVQKQIMITENQYSKLGAYTQTSMRLVLDIKVRCLKTL